jgi:hypothetical protein
MPVPEGFGTFEIEMREVEEEMAFIHSSSLMVMEADLKDHMSVLKKIDFF